MDCCSIDIEELTSRDVAEVLAIDPLNAPAPEDDPYHACRSCTGASRRVTRKTVLLMLKSELLDCVVEDEYRFCSQPDCHIVYFTETSSTIFVTSDLRVRVGLKEKTDPIPLCYCFGLDESNAREEICRTGRSTIPQRIAAFIKQKMCACSCRNPSGACCLVEVNNAVRRLMTQEVEPG